MLTTLRRWSVRAAGWGLALLLATLICAVLPGAARVPPPAPLSIAPLGPDFARETTLLPGSAAAVDPADLARFLRVVADDLDHDGDLDVVANVGTVDLLVWENDGAGHFTPWPSKHRPEWQAQPPEPSFHGDLGASNEWIQNDDGRVARLESSDPIVDARRTSALVATDRVAARQADPGVRTPRGPPLTLPL